MQVTTKDVKPESWPQIEKLFGKNGACGGCWCQAWRVHKGEHWKDIKGATAKSRLRRGVHNGTVHGVLAFVKDTPVGWCTFGPRESFPRLNRAPSLTCDDSSRVWSVPCFFVSRHFRDRGIAGALLKHSLRSMKRLGVGIVEGYPVKPDKAGKYIAAFSWTGTRSMFRKEGFIVVGNSNGGKQRVRKIFHDDEFDRVLPITR